MNELRNRGVADMLIAIVDGLKPNNRWSQRGLWQELFAALAACDDLPELGHDRPHCRARASPSRRGKRGGADQAIGRSRGGRTTKIHALADREGRPLRTAADLGPDP